MGLTVHYQGQLRSAEAYGRFVAGVEKYAGQRGWAVHAIAHAERELTRMIQPEDPEAEEFEEVYMGPTRGVYLLPHAECEPLTFEFDRDLFMQDRCKTQFAGWEVHAAVIGLLREFEGLFEMLDVQDEAGLWESGDLGALQTMFVETRRAIEEAAEDSPRCSVGVMTPSGRILDVLAA